MLGAGLLAKKAIETSLTAKPHVRIGLSPRSGTDTHYLCSSGVSVNYRFEVIGYRCSTYTGNTAPLPEAI